MRQGRACCGIGFAVEPSRTQDPLDLGIPCLTHCLPGITEMFICPTQFDTSPNGRCTGTYRDQVQSGGRWRSKAWVGRFFRKLEQHMPSMCLHVYVTVNKQRNKYMYMHIHIYVYIYTYIYMVQR